MKIEEIRKFVKDPVEEMNTIDCEWELKRMPSYNPEIYSISQEEWYQRKIAILTKVWTFEKKRGERIYEDCERDMRFIKADLNQIKKENKILEQKNSELLCKIKKLEEIGEKGGIIYGDLLIKNEANEEKLVEFLEELFNRKISPCMMASGIIDILKDSQKFKEVQDEI